MLPRMRAQDAFLIQNHSILSVRASKTADGQNVLVMAARVGSQEASCARNLKCHTIRANPRRFAPFGIAPCLCGARRVNHPRHADGKFNAVTFVAYLKELQKHFGKVVMICDRAPQHRSKVVREFLRINKNIRIMCFPKGSPHLNAVEECWRQGKRRRLVSKYYRTFSNICMAISSYYRVPRFNLELIKYVSKKDELIHANL